MVKLCPSDPGPASIPFFAWRFPVARASLAASAGAAGESSGEIGVDGLGDGLARPRPPLIRDELPEIGRIGDIAELDKHRRHVRRLEDAEARRPQRILVEAGFVLELGGHRAGKYRRKGFR